MLHWKEHAVSAGSEFPIGIIRLIKTEFCMCIGFDNRNRKFDRIATGVIVGVEGEG